MLEIISLIYITRHIGKLAEIKGQQPGRWKIISIIVFFVVEIMGFIISLLVFSPDNLVSIELTGFAFGISSYHFLKNYLEKLPDLHSTDDV